MSRIMEREIEEIMEEVVEQVVRNEEEERIRARLVQVGGASLKETKKLVKKAGGAFESFVTVANLEVELSRDLATRPDGAEIFSEKLMDLIFKYKPSNYVSSETLAGVVIESQEISGHVGLHFKPIEKITVEDIVQNMENMSQSDRSPLSQNSPLLNLRLTYVHKPSGSGVPPSPSSEISPPKKRCGRKRKFDTGALLELYANEKKRREEVSRNGGTPAGSSFINNEAVCGEDDEEEDFFDGGDIEEEMIAREEEEEMVSTPSTSSGSRGETNKMKNNVEKDCLPHAFHQAFCYYQMTNNPSSSSARQTYRNSLRKNGQTPYRYKRVFQEVEKMKMEAGVTKTENFGWNDIDAFQCTVFAGLMQIIVFVENSYTPFYKGPYVGEDRVLALYLEQQHFCGIRSIPRLLKSSYYCIHCEVRSNDVTSHYACKLLHRKCGKMCPTSPDDVLVDCDKCKLTFRSEVCYQNHLQKGKKGGKSKCDYTKFCHKCECPYYNNKNNLKHVCGEGFCFRCERLVAKVHYCTMTKVEKKSKLSRKRCYFDIESRADPATGQQFPVLFVALNCCPSCSPNIPKDWRSSELETCKDCSPEGRFKMIECITEENKDVDVPSSMVNWLFDADHKGFVCVAHNASGYDGQFILENLISSNRAAPDLCLDGSKLIFLNHKNVRLLDSMKFLNMSLASMGQAFEVDSFKGDFPVKFIKPENYGYEGNVPDDEFYALENKSSAARTKLKAFLEEERKKTNVKWNFREELIKYCYNDVYILSSSMTKFETAYEELAKVCLLEESVTIAAAAVLSFRREHLKPKFPIVLDAKPSSSYNSSIKSQKYLMWVAHEEKVPIKISTTSGEKKIGDYRVDGFIEACPKYPKGQIIEFNGCYFHAHTCRYADDSIIGDLKASEIREKDQARIKKLEESHPVKVVWECEVDRMLREDERMRKFFDNNEAKELLQMQRALVGGRTEMFRLTADNKNQTLHNVDVVSLYPTVMKHRNFPVGPPVDVPPSEMKTPMTQESDIAFEGFLQCRILAPKDLLLPLIPDKSSGKLVFALCKACVREENQSDCCHDDEERSFTGVYTTVELKKALSLGYVITEVFHGIKYESWLGNDENGQGGLFTSYVNDNMVQKIYSSGFPADVTTEEQKAKFIEDYAEKEQIQLVQSLFSKNPGRRAVTKIQLNSLWGKFAQRVDRIQNAVIMNPMKFFKILHDTSLEVMDVRPINDVLLVQYRTREEKLESLRTSAGHIAAYTTAYGRLHLYELMELVGAQNIIYCDTDSLIYVVPDGTEDPLAKYMGHHLGELTSELKGRMVKFDGVGPKSYAYKDELENGEMRIVVKAKGITLNSEADKIVTQETMEELVQEVLNDVAERSVIGVPQFTMRRDRDHRVYCKNIEKSFKFTFNKRRVLPNGFTLPFGYKR